MAGGIVATGMVIAITVWLIDVIPGRGDYVFVGTTIPWVLFWILAGAAWGRWRALVLPSIPVLAIAIAGLEPNTPIDQPLWVPWFLNTVIVVMPATAIGVGIGKALDSLFRSRPDDERV